MDRKVLGIFKKKRTPNDPELLRESLILKMSDPKQNIESYVDFKEATQKYPQQVIDFLVPRIVLKEQTKMKSKEKSKMIGAHSGQIADIKIQKSTQKKQNIKGNVSVLHKGQAEALKISECNKTSHLKILDYDLDDEDESDEEQVVYAVHFQLRNKVALENNENTPKNNQNRGVLSKKYQKEENENYIKPFNKKVGAIKTGRKQEKQKMEGRARMNTRSFKSKNISKGIK